MKRTAWIVVALAFFVGASFWIYEVLVESFSVSSIHLTNWPKKEYGKLACLDSVEDVRKIVNQPFTYLGKGRQFFAFASADGKYVFKFIKCQRVNVSDFYKNVPLPAFMEKSRKSRLLEKEQKIKGMFSSIQIAATVIPEQTGVVFAHLNSKEEVKKNVTFIDKLGLSHTVNIDEVPFVLQKRAILVKEVFSELFVNHEYSEINKRFEQLIDLIIADIHAKVYDVDSGTILRDNVGFLADRAIHVDVGTFIREPGPISRPYLEAHFSRLDPLLEWIAKKDPDLADSFHVKIKAAIKKCLADQ